MANDITLAQHETRAKIADLKRDLVAVVGKAETPDDPKIEALDIAIGQQEAKLRRLVMMEEAGKVFASQASIEELKARRKAAHDKAIQIAQDRISIAKKIDGLVFELGANLEKWRALGVECQRNAAEVHSSDRMPGWSYSMMCAARGDNGRFAGALDWALFQAQVGRAGISSDLINLRRPLGNYYSITEAAEYTAEQLTKQLDNSLSLLKED